MKEDVGANLQKTFRKAVAALESDLSYYEGELNNSISKDEELIAELPGKLEAQVNDFEMLVEQKFEQFEKILALMDKSIQRIMKSKTEKNVKK